MASIFQLLFMINRGGSVAQKRLGMAHLRLKPPPYTDICGKPLHISARRETRVNNSQNTEMCISPTKIVREDVNPRKELNMAQIDVTQIPGFEEMTADQKLEAVMKLDIPDKVDLSGYVKKSVFDAKAAEASDLSKKLKGKMTEDEQKQAEIAEAAEAAEPEEAADPQPARPAAMLSARAEAMSFFIFMGNLLRRCFEPVRLAAFFPSLMQA